jgi:hypothetical protein
VTWFRADDSFWSHPKTCAVLDDPRGGLAAIGLWALAGSWCGYQLTDGALTPGVLRRLGGTPKMAQALVEARAGRKHGLWEVTPDGWVFHDWHDYNPRREVVLTDRAERHEAKVRAGRIGGIRSGESRRSNIEAQPKQPSSVVLKQNEAPSRPVPSRPGVPSEHSETRAGARAGGRYTTRAEEMPGSARLRVPGSGPLPLGSVLSPALRALTDEKP